MTHQLDHRTELHPNPERAPFGGTSRACTALRLGGAVLTALATLLGTDLAHANNARRVASFQSSATLTSTIDTLDAAKKSMDAVLVTPNGDWMIISGTEIKKSGGIAASFSTAIQTKLTAGKKVLAGDCNEVGACAVVYDDWSTTLYDSPKVPSCFSSVLSTYKTNAWKVKDVEITDGACVFLGATGQATYSTSLDPELQRAIADRLTSGRTIEALAIGFDYEWALVAGHTPMYSGISSGALGAWLEFTKQYPRLTQQLVIGVSDDYIWYSTGNDAAAKTTPIGAVEWGLGAGGTSIWTRMEELGVTGASVALVSNAKLSTVRGYGRRRADDDLPILGRTPFTLASMSKFLGALTIASQDEGDANVSPTTDIITSNYLPAAGAVKSWKATGENAASAFRTNLSAKMGDPETAIRTTLRTPITLDCLMTHSCSIASEDDGASVVRQGLWSANNAKPTLDWLLGRSCGGDTCSSYGNQVWQVDTAAGSYDYDSANYLVLQAYLEDATGKSAHDNLKTRLLNKVGMPNTESHVNLSAAFQSDAAWKHTIAGTPDADMSNASWVFGGGIWSSAEDYANAMIVVLNQGVAANGTRVLNAATVNGRILASPGAGIARGWGVDFSGANASVGTDLAFYHGGSKAGAKTKMCGNATDKEGIVVLVNRGDAEAQTLIDEIVAAYLSKVSWKVGEDCK